jgi:hypothetical protein
MSPEQARIVGVALIALTAVLVGFQGASTLVTMTQLGASPPKASQPPRSHASLVPQPPVPVIKPNEQKASEPAPTISAGEETPAEPLQQSAAQQQPTQVVPDDQSGAAAAARAKARAEMDAMGPQFDEQEAAPRPEPRRRYRAPRPELHKVY